MDAQSFHPGFDGDCKMEGAEWPGSARGMALEGYVPETFLRRLFANINTGSSKMSGEKTATESKVCKNCTFWQKSQMNEFEGDCTADTAISATLEKTDACFTCGNFQKRTPE